MTNKSGFFAGLFLLCLSTLMLQVCLTRMLSVILYFHLSFFCISMAMLGMAAGALWVYLKNIGQSDYRPALTKLTYAYALSAALTPFLLVTTYAPTQGVTGLVALVKISLILALPFFLSGAAVSLCLTRANDQGSINLRYGTDLAGAAFGCLASIAVLSLTNGPVALMVASGLGILATLCFARTGAATARAPGGLWLSSYALLFGVIFFSAAPLEITSTKTPNISAMGTDYDRWNAFSHIRVTPTHIHPGPFYWGGAKDAPITPSLQRWLTIDGMAGTPYYSYRPEPDGYAFLDYDITSLAFKIRNQGRAAIIGVGGGRDVLAARHFGFADINVVELNPIIVDLLTKTEPIRSFAGLHNLTGVKYHVDEGRSWFARNREQFDLIQFSLVDTFAATGAGAFTLSENNLYTVEGWSHFMDRLTPTGVLTVSRFYAESSLDETAKLYTLALTTLFARGVSEPAKHIYIAAHSKVATLVLTAQPLTADELNALDSWVAKRGFNTIVRPDAPGATPLLTQLAQAKDAAAMNAIARDQLLDISAPTDARPFFFNQLRLRDLLNFSTLYEKVGINIGVKAGNLIAMQTLLFLFALAFAGVLAALIYPARHGVRGVNRKLAIYGTSYFGLIGLGFMLVEISLIQRLSVFLGYPVYGLAIALFSLILLTGVGSMLAQRLNLTHSTARLASLMLLTGAVVFVLALVGPQWLAAYEGAELPVRAAIALATIAPAALLMGMAMPTGMALTERHDARPTPWFWAVNGATGVLASVAAIVISIGFGIPTTMMAGGVCYLLLLIPALGLQRLKTA